MNENDIDYTQQFEEMANNQQELLKQSSFLLQRHLSVRQIKGLVEQGNTAIFKILLDDYEVNDPTKGASTRNLIEMVVVGCVFHYQKTDMLLNLFHRLEQKDLTTYIEHIKDAPLQEFLQAIEPYIVLPCGHSFNEILESVRTKRMLNQEITAQQHAKSAKKM